MSKKDREYYKRLKAIHKAHKPDKYEARKPYNWVREWGPFIKYDGDWDSSYLLELIIYKLERMYLALDVYSFEVRESLDKKLKVLQETIDLGKKIQTFDYYTGSQNFAAEHCSHYVYIYDAKVPWSERTLLAKVPQVRDPEKIDFKYIMGDSLAHEWVEANGYTKDQVQFAYGGEWDEQENHDKWFKMSQEEGKTKQKDVDKFFKLIAKNYREWWY